MRRASQLKRSTNVDSGLYELVMRMSQKLSISILESVFQNCTPRAGVRSVLASALFENFSRPTARPWRCSCANYLGSRPYRGGTPMPRQWFRAWRGSRGLSDSRQQRQRIERYFDCAWLSVWGEQRSRVSILSPTGCYIDSRFTVPAEGTVVRDITLTLPTGTLTLQGTVIATMRGVGFAVRFTELDKDTRDRLSALISSVRQTTHTMSSRPL